MPRLRQGTIVDGRFRIEDALGRGGMGTVFAAWDLRDGRRVAIKVPHRGDDMRLRREAQAVAKLASPHVARVIATGTLDDPDGAYGYVALEYLDGADLATWLETRGPISAAAAAELVRQACEALAEAHAAGIVHRDLKPANLFLTAAHGVKVLDFGISWSAHDERLTASGALLGSPAYMAPECMRPQAQVDPRSDLWSLGVVLYEAVSGRLPFESPAFPDLCLKILLDDMPTLATDDRLVRIVRRCLEKDPEHRFASAHELQEALTTLSDAAALRAIARELDRPSVPNACRLAAPAVALLGRRGARVDDLCISRRACRRRSGRRDPARPHPDPVPGPPEPRGVAPARPLPDAIHRTAVARPRHVSVPAKLGSFHPAARVPTQTEAAPPVPPPPATVDPDPLASAF